MTAETKRDLVKEGEQDYDEWRRSLTDTPEKKARYEAMAAKSELWLQLVEARQAAGLSQRELAKRLGVSQAQVARLEKRGYDAYSVNSLRRYVEALGEGFSLEVTVHGPANGRRVTQQSVSAATP
jgi:predicted XRE-type DNA-binding protein